MIQIFRLLCLCFWMLLLPTGLLCAEEGDDVLARMIHLSKEKNTVYRLLDKVSEQTGFLFIYDSKLIDNEKTVRIPKGDYTIRQAIYLITGNKELSLRMIGDHILISGRNLPGKQPFPRPFLRKRQTTILLSKESYKTNRRMNRSRRAL